VQDRPSSSLGSTFYLPCIHHMNAQLLSDIFTYSVLLENISHFLLDPLVSHLSSTIISWSVTISPSHTYTYIHAQYLLISVYLVHSFIICLSTFSRNPFDCFMLHFLSPSSFTHTMHTNSPHPLVRLPTIYGVD